MNEQEKAAANFISGYLRGLWTRIGEKPDPMVLMALRKLKVPTQFLPELPPATMMMPASRGHGRPVTLQEFEEGAGLSGDKAAVSNK